MAKAVDAAYQAIRVGILSGEFPQGSHLTAQQLAAATGLSRTPVREAMRRLHAEGMIRFIANRGAFVSSWTQEEIDQIYELRVILESFAAQEAAHRISPAQLNELRDIAVEMKRLVAFDKPDLTAIAVSNDRFHKAVLAAAGNARLSDLLAAIVEAPLVFNTFRRYKLHELQRSAAQHLELVRSFEARDPDWARSVMTSHIRSARHTLARTDNGADRANLEDDAQTLHADTPPAPEGSTSKRRAKPPRQSPEALPRSGPRATPKG
jgi:DNA-binding GntR family transcriptional regulator